MTDNCPKFAPKDCRTCLNRRIRCDRTLPHCSKCVRRGLECPGYGLNLRWTNSVAVRGRYKGFKAPVPMASCGQDPPELVSASNSTPEGQPLQMPSPGSVLPETMLPDEQTVKRLLEYYSSTVAPMNMWFDSDNNGYRRLIFPLAHKQPSVMLSLVAMAAAHMSSSSDADASFSTSAAEAAMRIITARIKRFTDTLPEKDHGNDETRRGDVEGMLASMLILSNYSLVTPDLTNARCHNGAARVLVNMQTLDRCPKSETFVFLQNQVAVLDVLACTTISNMEIIDEAVLPDLTAQEVLFGDFLILLHKVTRWAVTPITHYNAKNPIPSAIQLEQEFQDVKGLTLISAGRTLSCLTETRRRCVIWLSELYHHAAILYACDRLHLQNSEELQTYHSLRLFHQLEVIGDPSSMLINMVWPLFIAGAHCHGDPHLIGMVRSYFQSLIIISKFQYYQETLVFLEELWQTTSCDWVTLALQWEKQGHPVMAV